jgi:hypothetical protein
VIVLCEVTSLLDALGEDVEDELLVGIGDED